MMNQTISAIILTKNEEKNIQKCLQSLAWSDEIIVVDDFSEDKTVEKVHSSQFTVQNPTLKLKIFQRHLEGDFAGQRNFGLEKATGDWVLFIDADEIVPTPLASEIKSAIHNLQPEIAGYYIKRQDYFLGKWLKYGETGNIKLLRLARKNAGKWAGKVHETWEISGKTGELKSPLFHRPHQAITSFLTKINLYTDILADEWHSQGKKVNFLSIIFYPKAKFIQNYIIRLGFLDGIPGLVMAIMMSFHSFLARGKLWLRNKNA